MDSKIDYIDCFQSEFVHIFKTLCVTLSNNGITPKLFFDSLPHFHENYAEYGEEINKKALSIFARAFFDYVLNDTLTDQNTYKMYFHRNGSFEMIKKQFNLMWPMDKSLQEKQIAAFFDFAIALEYFLFFDDESRDEYYNKMKDNEEKVQEMLCNVYNALKEFLIRVTNMFIIKFIG